jgi:hypothetical protein
MCGSEGISERGVWVGGGDALCGLPALGDGNFVVGEKSVMITSWMDEDDGKMGMRLIYIAHGPITWK